MTAASNSEARKRAQATQTPASQPIPAPVDSGATGRLNEAEDRFENHLRWHFNVVAEEGKGSAYIGLGIANAKNDLERLVREHTDRALAEIKQRIEAFIRHGEAVPADVTTYDRWIVHEELRAIVRAARQERGR